MVKDLFPKILSCHLEYKTSSLHIFHEPFFSLHHNAQFLHLLPSAPLQHPQIFSAVPITHPKLFSATSGVLSSLPLHIWGAGEMDRLDPCTVTLASWTHEPYFLSEPAWMGLPSEWFTGIHYHRTEVNSCTSEFTHRSSSSTSILNVPRLPAEPLLKTQGSKFGVCILQTWWCNPFLVYVDPQISFK